MEIEWKAKRLPARSWMAVKVEVVRRAMVRRTLVVEVVEVVVRNPVDRVEVAGAMTILAATAKAG